MRVHQLANELNTSAHTVRFYTRIGFLKPARSRVNGYKDYGLKERDRLRFVLCARQLGFTVGDIAQIIGEADKGNSPCPLTREIIQSRLSETQQRYRETTALRKRMKKAVDQWNEKPDKVPTGHMVCHLVEDFDV